MITYTDRLDKALRIAAWAHETQGQHRKGSKIPYIIHPVGVMLIASTATNDEDTLISCLLHDVIEDVDEKIYSQAYMRRDFGDKVVRIVLDVTKDDSINDWRKRSEAYLEHIKTKACNEAVTVCVADKIHNVQSTLIDYRESGDELWNRFATSSYDDQLWWYKSVLEAVTERGAPKELVQRLSEMVNELEGLRS